MGDKQDAMKGQSRGQPLIILVLVISLFFLARTLIPQEKLSVNRNIVASYPFNGTLGRGVMTQEGPLVEAEGTGFESSRFGDALRVSESSKVTLALSRTWNLSTTGMISFWFRTGREATDGRFYRLLYIPDGDLSLHKDQHNRLIFRIGKRWIAVPARWAANYWNHAAVGWWKAPGEPEGDMVLYLNGRKADLSNGPGSGRLNALDDGAPLWIASSGEKGSGMSGLVDELILFNRILSEREVRSLYGHSVRVSDLAQGKEIVLARLFANLAYGREVTGSAPPINRWHAYSLVTDGNIDNRSWAVNGPDGKGLNYIQVDLGKKIEFNEIHLWHDHAGVYDHNKLEVSETGAFTGEQTTIFDSDRDGAYPESVDGKVFRFDTVSARYIRNWIQGTRHGGSNNWLEMQVFNDEFPLPSSVPEQIPPAPVEAPLEPGKTEGLAVFLPPPFQPVIPQTVPLDSWMGSRIEAMGAPGQFVPAAVGFRADRDLGEVRLESDPLVDGIGNEVAWLNLHVVKVRPRQPGFGGRNAREVPIPDLLVKDDREPLRGVFTETGDFPEVRLHGDPKTDLLKDASKVFWITCEISASAPPGDYATTIRLVGAEGEHASLDYALKILPVYLRKPRNRSWGIYFQLIYSGKTRDQLNPQVRASQYPYFDGAVMRSYIKDVHDHGFNVMALLGHDFNGPEGGLAKMLLLSKEIGVDGPIVVVRDPWAYRDNPNAKRNGHTLATYVKAVVSFARENGLPKPVFYQEDEPHGKQIKLIANRSPIIHEQNGYTLSAINGNYRHPAVAQLDYPVIRPSSVFSGRTAATILRRQKKSPWYYGQMWAWMPERTRMFTGYHFWLRNFEGILPYTYMRIFNDPYNDADGKHKDYCMSFPTRRGPINTLSWEAAREGVYDYMYVDLFLNLADLAKHINKDDPARMNRIERLYSDLWNVLERQLSAVDNSYKKDRREIVEAVLDLYSMVPRSNGEEPEIKSPEEVREDGDR